MKTLYKSLVAALIGAPLLLSSCIEETFPTNGVTAEQLGENSKGVEAVLRGMPAFMKKYQTWTTSAFDYGYPSILCILNVQTQDCNESDTGYDWYSTWAEANIYINSNTGYSQFHWYYMNLLVQATNSAIAAAGENPETAFMRGARAQGLIYRASTYLDMARMYEFLPNEVVSPVNTDGHDVTGLTVPIVTENMSDDERMNNPRATHERMVEFLLGDLQEAVDLYTEGGTAPSSKDMPSLAVAYGVMARVYMWDENYPKAAEYAEKAIAATNATPLTKEEWLSTTDGFNNSSVSSWMWSIEQESENDAVQSWTNWTSFMSPELLIGYGGGGAGAGNTYFHIDRGLYDQIDNRDFRKLSFKAPEGHPLAGKEPNLDAERFAELDDYAGVKFRPGSGNMTDESVAFATAIPLMRVEEMYFIQAEAVAHSNPAEGKTLIEKFMQTYRFPQYTCSASIIDDVVDEIVLQKRIEFWGEGITFFDFKRLNMSVIRAYDGTNWPAMQRLNTNGRPAWMNMSILDYESDFNKGVSGYLNPNCGQKYTPVR
ncbi:MAG: RagB/SusD family nutrient uptake outer membrane protein [Paramuribaculum sp.]|nr:RagB/SusD family nutrient uptake outer membrane protein [Paramuribaculum sp.]